MKYVKQEEKGKRICSPLPPPAPYQWKNIVGSEYLPPPNLSQMKNQ